MYLYIMEKVSIMPDVTSYDRSWKNFMFNMRHNTKKTDDYIGSLFSNSINSINIEFHYAFDYRINDDDYLVEIRSTNFY